MKIAVLIRVYDRIEDLKYNLQIISDTWKDNDYYVIVVSNGLSKGFTISKDMEAMIDKLVVLKENSGHRKGNSQLLLEGIKYIPQDCKYTLILEADTWKYTDDIITKYSRELENHPSAVWASADWYDKSYALATDFALVKNSYLMKNPKLFDFELYPECHISNFLRDNNGDYIWMTENMPVHVPSYVKKYPYVPNSKEGRFYVFPKSRMVTHHNEYLKLGIEKKKRYFNIVAGEDYFISKPVKNKAWYRFRMSFWINLTKLMVKKSWFRKKRYMHIPEFE